MGTYQGADTASVSMTLPKDAVSGLIVLYMYQINPDVLEQGFAALQNLSLIHISEPTRP